MVLDELSMFSLPSLECITSISLMVGGFFMPPTGVIDGSVLTAVGLLLAFRVIRQIPEIINSIHEGKRLRITKGDFSAEVENEPLKAE